MFQYLNHNNEWPRFRLVGLQADAGTGALSLRKLPGPATEIGRQPGDRSAAPSAAGIAVGNNGTIYVSDPAGHAIRCFDPISGEASQLCCVGAKGWEAGRLHRPQGLAFQVSRNRLLIADALNRRIQVIDPVRERVIAVWGQTYPYGPRRPCGDEGGLNSPEQLACGHDDNVYVIDRADPANACVVKLDADGRRVAKFACPDRNPFHVATGKLPGSPDESVFVLTGDDQQLRLRVFAPDGTPVIGRALHLLHADPNPPGDEEFVCGYHGPESVTGFAVFGGVAVVSLGGVSPRVWCFELGEAPEGNRPAEPSWLPLADGTAVALGVRGGAELLIAGGPGRALLALPAGGACRRQGAFLAGPFTGSRGRVTNWRRLRFEGTLPADCFVQWFTLSRNDNENWTAPPRLPRDRFPKWFLFETQPDLFESLGFGLADEPEPDGRDAEFHPVPKIGEQIPAAAPDLTPGGIWYSVPENQFDGLIRNSGGTTRDPADQLWVIGLVAGDGVHSASLSQAKIEFDEDGWLADLPAVYQRQPRSRALLQGFLSLLQSRFEDVTDDIARLASLFSPHAMTARHGRTSPELDWLRETLALPPIRRLSGETIDRDRNAQAFADGGYWLARRGTPEGFRRLVWLATGIDVVIDEPGVFELPGVLAPPASGAPQAGPASAFAPAGGAVGHDTLPDPDDERVRLPGELAHHFIVRGYESDLSGGEMLQLLERTVAELAPAHTTYSVQVIRPRARVGIQCRLGIDAVVAPCEPADPMALGDAPGPDVQADPNPLQPTVGSSRLGMSTPLI